MRRNTSEPPHRPSDSPSPLRETAEKVHGEGGQAGARRYNTEGPGRGSWGQGQIMLQQVSYLEPDELDQMIFEVLVPQDHYLRQVLAILSFDGCSSLLAECYSLDQGR